MTWLLDTNIVSELRKQDRANSGLRTWFESAEDRSIYTSVLVVGELRRGIESVRRRDPSSAIALERWLQDLEAFFAGRILPVDQAAADCWRRLNVPNPTPTVDGLLAATAIVNGLTLVTRNTRDVARTGVSLLNPMA